jgi:cell division protein FtsB
MKKRKHRIIKPSYIYNFIFAVLVYSIFSFIIFYNFSRYKDLKNSEALLYSKLSEEQDIHDGLQYELKYINSDDYIEKIAKQELGLIHLNEIVFYPE